LLVADDFPNEVAWCLETDEYVQIAKTQIAEEYREELFNLIAPGLGIGPLDPRLTIPTVFERLKWRRYVEMRIVEVFQEFSDWDREKLMREDSFGFWGRYRLGIVQLLQMHDPPLSAWQLEVASVTSEAYRDGPAIRRLGFRDLADGFVGLNLPTFVDMCDKDLEPQSDTNYSAVHLSDLFKHLDTTEESLVFLYRYLGQYERPFLQFDVVINGEEGTVRIDFIRDPSLI